MGLAKRKSHFLPQLLPSGTDLSLAREQLCEAIGAGVA
jgi:hypothetical protein